MAATPPYEPEEIIRDDLKEHHGDWFVEYNCANRALPFAVLNIVFMKRATDFDFVRRTMEEATLHWLKRYPVPLMVYGFNEREETIRFQEDAGNHMLTGFVALPSQKIVSRWGLMKDSDYPPEQQTDAHRAKTYADVTFRTHSDIKAKLDREGRNIKRGTYLILFFIVVVPFVIELIALGVTWLGWVLSVISIGAGLYKIATTFGWLKPSAQKEKEAEEERKMKHHHYHCVRNPEAFARLRAENFARETSEKLKKESDALAAASNSRASGD